MTFRFLKQTDSEQQPTLVLKKTWQVPVLALIGFSLKVISDQIAIVKLAYNKTHKVELEGNPLQLNELVFLKGNWLKGRLKSNDTEEWREIGC